MDISTEMNSTPRSMTGLAFNLEDRSRMPPTQTDHNIRTRLLTEAILFVVVMILLVIGSLQILQ